MRHLVALLVVLGAVGVAVAAPSLEDSMAAIDSMDLSAIRARVMKEQGWSAAKTDEVVSEYRRFWILHRKYPQQRLVPSKDVDEVWHAHILYTRKYAADCERAFGGFLHHFPSAETDSARDTDRAGYLDVLTIYTKEFGRPGSAWLGRNGEDVTLGDVGACGGSCDGSCGSGCGSCGTQPTNGTKVMCPMSMYFGAQIETCIWLKSWHITDGAQYAGAVIGILAMCLLREWITAYRQSRHVKARKVAGSDGGLSLLEGNVQSLGSGPSACNLFVDSLFYGLNVTLAYLLMLLVMTYNVGICLAIIIGLVLGNFIFTYYYSKKGLPLRPAEADHCCPSED